MADITKCLGTECNLKEHCVRFTSKEGLDYFTFPPIKNGKCDMFWGGVQESIYNHLKFITSGK